MKSYTWICDCGADGGGQHHTNIREVRKDVMDHLRSHKYANDENYAVYIDEYDEVVGELSGIYWKLESKKVNLKTSKKV